MDGTGSGGEVSNNTLTDPAAAAAGGVDDEDNGVTLTVRLIRSFEFRNWRPVVVKGVQLSSTTKDLAAAVERTLKSSKLPPPFKNFAFDCFKIEYQAFGLKTNDPLINTEEDERLMLKPDLPLGSQGIKSETEISYFRLGDYLQYKEAKSKKTDSDSN